MVWKKGVDNGTVCNACQSTWNTNTILGLSGTFPFLVSAKGVQAPSPPPYNVELLAEKTSYSM